jgi:hypothetical protein
MEKAPDGIGTRLLEGGSLNAADDPVIAGTRAAGGWDPFEIRRTRVRGLPRNHPREGKDKTD